MRKRRCGESQQKRRSPQEPYTVVFQVKEAIFEGAYRGEWVARRWWICIPMSTGIRRSVPGKAGGGVVGITSHHVLSMINYICDHFDEFKLCCAAERREAQRRLLPVWPGGGTVLFRLCGGCKSWISGAGAGRHAGSYPVPILFQQLQEFISHDLPRERALSCALLGRFSMRAGPGY